MVNNNARGNKGYLLLELLVNITIIMLLFGSICTGFALTSKLHYQMMNYLAMQSQLRFVADSIVRDVTYADNCEVQPHKLIIYTKHDQPKLKVFSYEVNKGRIVRDTQPMTGDEATGNIKIEQFVCTMPRPQVVVVKLQAVELTSNKHFMLDTAALIRNSASNVSNIAAPK